MWPHTITCRDSGPVRDACTCFSRQNPANVDSRSVDCTPCWVPRPRVGPMTLQERGGVGTTSTILLLTSPCSPVACSRIGTEARTERCTHGLALHEINISDPSRRTYRIPWDQCGLRQSCTREVSGAYNSKKDEESHGPHVSDGFLPFP